MFKVKNMLKKLCTLFFCVMTGAAQAQMLAPAQGAPQAKAAQSNKPAQASVQKSQSPKSSDTPVFDENGAPNYVVKNFNNNEPEVYDNSERKVYTLKMVDGDIVIDNPPRSILISYEDYKINRSFDDWVRCSLRIYVLNDLTERVTNFSFKLHWPDMDTAIQMNRLNPGVRTYKDVVLLGEGCYNLDKAPTVEVNRCRVKGMTQEQCADAVKWYQSKK